MNMAGRKVGSCDAQQARNERDAKQAQIKGQIAQGQEALRKQNEEQIRQCGQAVDTMEMNRFGIYSQCRQSPEACKGLSSDPASKPVATACMARTAEFCKRYQTEEGFLKAKGDERVGEMCGLSAQKVRDSLCPRAAQNESLGFLGRYCLAEAKPVAEKHCAGRDFTSRGGSTDKYTEFCRVYYANASLGERGAARQSGSTEQQAPSPASPTDAVQQSITEGLGKLKGLFGR
jgi:hypothetical protein